MRRLTCFEVACVVFRGVGVHATQAAKGWIGGHYCWTGEC